MLESGEEGGGDVAAGYVVPAMETEALFTRAEAMDATLHIFGAKADDRRADVSVHEMCRALVDEQTRLLRCIDDCASRKVSLTAQLADRQAQRARRNAGIQTLTRNVDAMRDDRTLRRMKFAHEKKELDAECERAKTACSAIRTRVATATSEYNDDEDRIKAETVATLAKLGAERERLTATIDRLQSMLQRRTAEHDGRRATLQHYTRMLLNFAQTEVGTSMAVVPTYADAAGGGIPGAEARRAAVRAQAATEAAEAEQPEVLLAEGGSVAAAAATAAVPRRRRDLARMSGWSAAEVSDWVRDELLLPGVAPTFEERGVDGAQLLRLTAARAGADLGLGAGELGVLFAKLKRARELAEANGEALIRARPVVEWTIDEAAQWLAVDLELPQYDALFRANTVAGGNLAQLTDAGLEAMGVKHKIHRRKIVRAAAALVGSS